MIFDTLQVPILLYNKPMDMRRAIDGLATVISESLAASPQDGTFYVFYNKQGDKVKLLYWQNNAFCLWYKRLEKGKFKLPRPGELSLKMTLQQLRWFLDGLDFSQLPLRRVEKYDLYY